MRAFALVLVVACAAVAHPAFDPENVSTWGAPQLLVENGTQETLTILGPSGIIGRVWPGEHRCFTLHERPSGVMHLVAEIDAYHRVETLDFLAEDAPGWRWTLTTAWRYDVHVVPAWPCHDEPPTP